MWDPTYNIRRMIHPSPSITPSILNSKRMIWSSGGSHTSQNGRANGHDRWQSSPTRELDLRFSPSKLIKSPSGPEINDDNKSKSTLHAYHISLVPVWLSGDHTLPSSVTEKFQCFIMISSQRILHQDQAWAHPDQSIGEVSWLTFNFLIDHANLLLGCTMSVLMPWH